LHYCPFRKPSYQNPFPGLPLLALPTKPSHPSLFVITTHRISKAFHQKSHHIATAYLSQTLLFSRKLVLASNFVRKFSRRQ
jgi:hypothetical protein